MRTSILAFLAAAVTALPGKLPAQADWGPGDSDIVLSEVHYNPPESASAEEFLELHNRGVHWVDLGGWTFTQGIKFTMPAGTVLPPGGYLVVARDRDALSRAAGISNLVGDYKGALQDSGEILELRSRTGRVVTWLHYLDGKGPEGGLWPEAPDGEGPSLELIRPHPDWQRPWYWSPSRLPGGTPGRKNSRAARPDGEALPAKARQKWEGLTINEVRLEEPDAFAEIFNEGGETVSLDGLKLTRHLRGKGGLDLSGSLGRGRFHVVPGEELSTLQAETTPILFLLDAESLEIVDSLQLGPATPPGGSFGRYPRGSDGMSALPKATPRAHNVAPVDVPVVINEILYHGRDGDDGEEFIELHNRGKTPVSLEDWRLGRGVTFQFPDDAVIPAAGHVVVAKDPEKLRSGMPPGEAGAILGPLKGRLSNSGETITLTDAWGNLVDRLRYSDRPPWPQGADGGGFSLELLHPDLDNSFSQAWTLGRPGGSPGRKNSRSVKSMRPVIGGVSHDPPVPRPGDRVLIHAHVLDTGSLSRVAVVFRDLSAGTPPRTKSLSDSGQLQDGAPRDGHYTTRLPAFRAGAIVGFSIVARDGSGRTGRAPEDSSQEHFFQVEPKEAGQSTEWGMPCYRVILPPADWDRFMSSPRRQDNWFWCTLVASIEGKGVNRRKGSVHYGAEIRYRGNNSRNPPDGRMSYRIRLAGGELYDGRDRIILNAFKPLEQKAGGDALRMAGIPVSDATVVRLKTPTFDDRQYIDVEVVNNEFLDKKLGSSAGDVFRGRRGNPFGADLSYHGPDPAPYLNVYERMNKKGDENIPGLLELLRVLDEADDSAYVKQVPKVIDPLEWALYFAANNVLGNTEGGLSTGQADDYFIAERPSDGRFLLVPWDQDSTFDRETLELYPRRLPSTRRFLEHPGFAPLYHRGVRELLDGPLSSLAFRRWMRHFEGVFSREELGALETFVRRRQVYLRERVPLWPRVTARIGEEPSPVAGTGLRVFVPTGPGEISLLGFADPATTHGILLDETTAVYDAVRGRWETRLPSSALGPGPNALWISCLGGKGDVVALHSLNVERVDTFRDVPAVIRSDTRWAESGGPYVLRGKTTVLSGASLEIGPGVNVVCAPEASLEIRGRIEARGTTLAPITFRPAGDGRRMWKGVHLLRTGTGNLSPRHEFIFCRFEGGRGADPEEGAAPALTDGGFLRAEGARLLLEHCLFRGISGSAVALGASTAEIRRVRIVDSRTGLVMHGGRLIAEGLELARIHADGLELVALSRERSGISGGSLKGVLGTGVTIRGGGLTLENLVIHGSDVGVEVSGGARVVLSNSTLASVGTGVALDPPTNPGSTRKASRVDVTSCVLWPCEAPVKVPRGSALKLSGCLIGPPLAGEPFPAGEGNIHAVPSYVAPLSGDFRLQEDSPGRGKSPAGKGPGYVGSP